MNEKKEEYSTKAGIILIINTVLYVVWAASPVLLLVILMALIVNGEFIMVPVLLVMLVGWVIFTRFFFNHDAKRREKEEQDYRAANITQYTVDCGWLGTLRFDYDKKINRSKLVDKLPDIFVTEETAELSADTPMVDGKVIEMIINRLFTDRVMIFQETAQRFEQLADRLPDLSILFERVHPTALRLLEINIEGSDVHCEFVILGLAEDVFATVSFVNGFFGYNYVLRSGDFELPCDL